MEIVFCKLVLALVLLVTPIICYNEPWSCRKNCPSDCVRCVYTRKYGQRHFELDCAGRRTEKDVQLLIEKCVELKSTHALILTNVMLRSIPTDFSKLSMVRHVNFSNNGLQELIPGTFDTMVLINELILNGNHIKKISSMTFGLVNLYRLYLRRNRIQEIAPDAFSSAMSKLEFVDLSENLLKTLSGWPLHLYPIKLTVILDLNNIQRFNVSTHWQWSKASMMRINIILNMDGNNVQHISDLLNGWKINKENYEAYMKYLPFKLASMHRNQLWCDCRDYDLLFGWRNTILRTLNQSRSGLPYCEGPERLRGKLVTDLEPQDLQCQLRCLPNCRCSRQPWEKVIAVKCRRRFQRLLHRREVPELPDDYSYSFDISHSVLPPVLLGMPRLFTKATALDLSWTQMENITQKAFSRLRQISKLYLNDNKLTRLPMSLTDMDFSNLKSLHLYNNPWKCECQDAWMLAWLRKSVYKTLKRPLEIKCASPAWLSNRPILTLRAVDFCVDPQMEQIVMATSGAAIALFVVLSTVVCVYCNRVEIHSRFQWHPFDRDECHGERKLYDAFIMFHEHDATWVTSVLLEKLLCHSPPYRACTHDRACIPGMTTYDQVQHAVENSKRTVVIATEDYISDNQMCADFEEVYRFLGRRQRSRLIVVTFAGVSTKLMPISMQNHLSTGRAGLLRYGRPRFWTYFLYKLPVTAVRRPHQGNMSMNSLTAEECHTLLRSPKSTLNRTGISFTCPSTTTSLRYATSHVLNDATAWDNTYDMESISTNTGITVDPPVGMRSFTDSLTDRKSVCRACSMEDSSVV